MVVVPRHRGVRALIVAVVLLLAGCNGDDSANRYVARVGDRYLLQEDVDRQLAALPVRPDSIVARQQIIEQWVMNELLYKEAQRRGLQNDAEVKRLLEDSQRTVLVNAIVERMYEENEVQPTAAEVQAYYERHKDQLGLRESFVRVRYLEVRDRSEAESARQTMAGAAIAERDSVWNGLIDRLAIDPAACRGISNDYFPESRIFAGSPAIRDALGRLADGDVSAVIPTDSSFVVIQLAERVPPQTIPELQWIEEELARRLVIEGRKQLYARQVQRLRNEALAREDLEIR